MLSKTMSLTVCKIIFPKEPPSPYIFFVLYPKSRQRVVFDKLRKCHYLFEIYIFCRRKNKI